MRVSAHDRSPEMCLTESGVITRNPCMLMKTAIFVHQVSFLIFPQVGKQTGFARTRMNVGESLSVGVTSRVMVT
ncbi:hypothetical protein Hanom_Chr07g00596651 [Helianthus anomalus]